MTKLFLPALVFICTTAKGQDSSFGQLPISDKNITAYPADPTAHALVLYEKGDNYFEIIKDYILLVKEYHVRIKILDEKGFDEGTISIPYYHNDGSTEKVENIKAVIHNGDHKTFVREDKIYTKDLSPNVSEKTFTFPDLREGAILEYSYRMTSPFIFNLNGWSFQSNLPKLYSEFNATIPAYYTYNRNLSGSLPLKTNEANLLRECFRVPGTLRAADCEVMKYVMTDIPAFKEEGYMLAASNYISRIDFELSEHRRLDGITDRYTKSWEDVDKEFRNDRDLGVQLTKKGFFERNVPEKLLTEGSPLERAMNIFDFVRDHYTWNGEYGIYRDIRVKDAFDARRGNVGEINISLINLLNAAGLPTEMMLLSTRAHGLPKRSHPVMSDFNYLVARTVIDGKKYLLDASDPFTPFGMLPFRCLNYYGRVMDFKNDSYWEDIVVDEPNRVTVRVHLGLEDGLAGAEGVLDEINMGYEAISRRSEMAELSRETYLDSKEDELGAGAEISDYTLLTESAEEKRVSERFKLKIKPQLVNGTYYFNPFLIALFEQEPFVQEERMYPIDFGYARNYSYTLSLTIPEGYTVEQLPSAMDTGLRNQIARLKFDVAQTGNNFTFMFNLNLNYPHVAAEYYKEIKDLFAQVSQLQKNSLVAIKKI